MASFTLTSDRFPNGTSVSVYEAGWTPRTGSPSGSVVASGSVSSGSVTFTGLDEDTKYEAYASVNSEHRYVRFSTFDDPPFSQRVVPERNVELGYAENTSAPTNASTTPADVSGLTVTVTVTDRPILVQFGCKSVSNTSGTTGVLLRLIQGASTVIDEADASVGTANGAYAADLSRRLSLDPGEYTFKVQLAAVGSGTAYIKSSTSAPAWLQVIEV